MIDMSRITINQYEILPREMVITAIREIVDTGISIADQGIQDKAMDCCVGDYLSEVRYTIVRVLNAGEPVHVKIDEPYEVHSRPAKHTCDKINKDESLKNFLKSECAGCDEARMFPCEFCRYGTVYREHDHQRHLNNDLQASLYVNNGLDTWTTSPHITKSTIDLGFIKDCKDKKMLVSLYRHLTDDSSSEATVLCDAAIERLSEL